MAPDESKASAPKPDAAAAQQQAMQVAVDATGMATHYVNWYRVTGTPEELILDFGLNAQPFGEQNEPVAIQQRVVMNFYTAKRMLAALQVTIQRHEAAFGLLETDIQKRVVPGASPVA